jgi:outer membrane cobalamin receptor
VVRSLTLAFSLLFLIATVAAADELRGRVTDPQGQPVRHANVLVLRGGVVIATATTTTAGQFGPLTLPAGEYDITVSAPGMRAAPTRVSIAEKGVAEVTLKLELTAVTESVVVSASQVDRPLSRLTDSVTVVEKSDFESRQTETASDALRLVPGFGVIASGARGALTSIFPRGGESDYTHVMIDGLPLNTFGGGFDGAHLSAAGVERMEVVRGPQSALFGSGAIGGVVSLSTLHGGPDRGQVVLEGGGLGFGRVATSGAGSFGQITWGGVFERSHSDGDTSVRDSIGGPVSNDDYTRTVGSFSMGWSDRVTRSVRVDARFTSDERGNPGPYGSDPEGNYGGLDTISRGINHSRGVAGVGSFGDPLSLRHRVQASYLTAPSTFVSPFGTSDDRTRRFSGRYQADMERQRAGFSFGMELLKERSDNTFITGEAFDPIPVERLLAGWFAESRFEAGIRGAVTAGLRLDRIQRNALEGNPSPFGPRPAFDDEIVWSLNPKISAVWFVGGSKTMDSAEGWTKVRGGAGTGIKPPTSFEIAFTDNPGLKPERSISLDAGIEHVFPGARIALDATVFANRYDDLIVFVGSSYMGPSQFRTDNIANASATGVELGARWQTAGRFLVRAAYTFLSTEVLDIDDSPGTAPFPFVVGDPLIRRPNHQASLEVRYTQSRLTAFAIVNGRGEMLDLEPNFASSTYMSGGYAVMSAGATVSITKTIQGYARVNNLFDRVYEDALGFPAPGVTGVVGVRLAIGR